MMEIERKADKTLLERVGRYCRMTQWPTLMTGGVLATSGVGWCLSSNFKGHSSEWTTPVAFIVGSVGLSLVYSSLYDAYLASKQKKDSVAIPPIWSRIANFELTDELTDRLELRDRIVLNSLTVAVKELKSCESKCSSCKSFSEKLNKAFYEFKEGLESKNSSPGLCKLFRKATNEYKIEQGYPDVVLKYKNIVAKLAVELNTRITANLRGFQRNAQQLIVDQDFHLDKNSGIFINEECFNKFYLPSDLSEETREHINELVTKMLLHLEKTFCISVKEFVVSLYKMPDMFFNCDTERIFMLDMDKLLYTPPKSQVG